ncbi:hypothetical protein QVD17_09154 [Tagetes erecta]|uniref:AP2/ERF domain-containing protein n=1 Tax=Tagetes erecta TaxID=13708 RepID=A0AAD8P4T3_TARER|nr:hypothetical protein QVD17_09154 [Tagetes erecta]
MVKKEPKIDQPSTISKKKYKGVRMRSWGSWVSEIRAPNQKTRIWLGSYSTPEAAARAYDAALLCLKGPTANLNFSHTEYNHYHPSTTTTAMSPKSIQKIAAAAAAAATTTPQSSPLSSSPQPASPPPSSPSYSSSLSISSTTTPPYISSLSSSTTTPPPTNIFEDLDPFDGTLMSLVAPWSNLSLPSYNDEMVNTSFYEFDHSSSSIVNEDVYEEGGDIYLWSFC